jgi:hypothetical protein
MWLDCLDGGNTQLNFAELFKRNHVARLLHGFRATIAASDKRAKKRSAVNDERQRRETEKNNRDKKGDKSLALSLSLSLYSVAEN